MSDSNLATRSPENDAMEDQGTRQPSLITYNDSTVTPTGPQPTNTTSAVGEHCTTDRPLPRSSDPSSPPQQQPSGQLTQFSSSKDQDDIQVYISKPADYPNTPGKLLLLLTGGTGVKSINNQLQADMFAQQGFVVVMPDQFGGDEAPGSAAVTAMSPTAEVSQAQLESDGSGSVGGSSAGGWEKGITGFMESFKLRVVETAKSFTIDMWLARQTEEKVLPRIARVLDAVKEEYADAIENGGGIYAVGYCFGAKYVLILAGKEAGEVLAKAKRATAENSDGGDAQAQGLGAGPVNKGPQIKAGAIAHATLVTREDVTSVQAPVSMVCVEDDPLFPAEILDEGKKALGTSNVEHEIKIYSGVPHGFAVVGDYDDEHIKKEQERAFEQMLGWLKAH